MADIKVRVGQQNAIKVVSSISGAAGGAAIVAINVIGGIASVTNLSVSGVSTFSGLSTFRNTVYTTDLYSNRLFYPNSIGNGVAYFTQSGILTSTTSPFDESSLASSNALLTTDNTGKPRWAIVIDGGTY